MTDIVGAAGQPAAPADGDDVTVGFSSSRNVTFHGEGEELGYTWGQWRKMTAEEKTEALTDFIWTLVDDVWVEGAE